ncbi:hypothetical protein PENSTE_c001G03269 [Penicillium steckii]|uniref:Magnesium transporter n=1 Tax=Penicillium steckii TaxID=303698 RepID=A0A1V6U191_9EURO|nr:hypothetical protein PENSTE_c001G03269 [Penicillium steckii]
MPTNEVKRDDSFNQEVFNLSLALTHSRLNDSTELQCILFHADSSFEPSCQSMTKARIAKEYDLDARDLRNIDLVSTGLPHILVRPDTIFASLFSLRLLIKSNTMLLVLLESEDNHVRIHDVLLKDLQNRLQTPQGLAVGLSGKLSFEHRVLDAALAAVIATLEAESVLIRRDVERSLSDSQKEDSVHTALRRLRRQGKRLVNTEQRARQVRSALQEILSNDEDMAMMYLTDRRAGHAHLSADHQEVEYLLEAYNKNADAIAESANSLIGDVNRTIDTIQSVLDIRRNEIMIFEAQLEIWMLGFAVSTFVAGLFGMNVINSFEESIPAFTILVSGCMLGTVLIARYGMRRLKKFRRPQL